MAHSTTPSGAGGSIQSQAPSILNLAASLTLGRVTFTLRSQTGTRLPPYLGSTLRGAMGAALRSIACVRDRNTSCLTCPLIEGCAYAYLFETPVPSGARHLRRLQHLPRPFIIEPPPIEPYGLRLEPGSVLTFSMVLIGRAVNHLPYVLLAVSRMGSVGLGADRAQFELVQAQSDLPPWLADAGETVETQVDSCGGEGGEGHREVNGDDVEFDHEASSSPQPLWTPDSESITGLCKVTPTGLHKVLSTVPSGFDSNGDYVQVEFITPARLVEQGRVVSELAFKVFFRSLLSRVSSLALFHCGYESQDLDYRSVVDAADEFQGVEHSLTRCPLQRWSGRQRRNIGLDGLVGKVSWRGGALPHMLPLIRVGQVLHVGKGTVFGLGRYRLL